MSTALSLRNESADLPSQEVAHAIAGTIEQLKAIRTFIKAEFDVGYKDQNGKIVAGLDAGLIPGCGDKPTLFLPGAQKATMYFNCYPTYKVKKERLDDRGHIDVIVRCLLISRATREQVGEGVGSCSTMEKKYRYRKAQRNCPKCGEPSIIKGKQEYGGGWVCWSKDGPHCKAKFPDNAPAIVSQPEGQAENPDLYDLHNTVLKIAKKRAHVDAAITLGCLSELFTQDIEDTYAPAAVMDAARPYGGEVEVVEEPAPPERPKSHPGMFGKEHQKKVPGFLGWLKAGCSHHIGLWREAWGSSDDGNWGDWFPFPEDRAEALMTAGFAVPERIADPINIHKAKGHLWKWAVNSGRVEGVDDHRGAKPAQVDAFLTRVYDDPAGFEAMKQEMKAYASKEKRDAEARIYAQHPHLAPDGYFDAEPDRGDAYDGPGSLAEAHDSPDPAEAGKSS